MGVEDLKLSDYKKIWTKFCFLDESGSLGNPKEPFFTIGFIKCSQPYYLQSRILYERQKKNFHDELKFNKLSRKNIDFAKFIVDSFFSVPSLHFYSYSLDKQGLYFSKEFGGDPWKAYEDISIRVIEQAIPFDEIIFIVADHITTPKGIKFEVNVKWRINDNLKRLGIGGVCRFDSKSNDLLQATDLLVGAINYDLKLKTNLITKGDKYKKMFLEYLKSNIGIDTFLNGFKSHMFNIFIDKDVKQRLPIK